jgi:hypothetical protein
MMKHPTDEELNEYHDGALTPADRATLEEHLAACTVCDDRSAALAELLDQLHGVPSEVVPSDATWDAIRASIETARTGDTTTDVARGSDIIPLESPAVPATPARRSRWMLAAAALVLMAASSATTLWLVGGADEPSPDQRITERITNEESLARFAELEAAYLRAAAELVDALERERRSIPPDVAAHAERSLLVIDEAVRETRAALADDPDNVALAELALAAHRRKLEFLQRVRQWSTES